MQILALATLIGTVGAFNMRVSSRTGARSSLQMFTKRDLLPALRHASGFGRHPCGDAGLTLLASPIICLLRPSGGSTVFEGYREAEIVHGRVAQLAVIGQLFLRKCFRLCRTFIHFYIE